VADRIAPLIAKVEAAQKELEKAEAALEADLLTMPLGTVFVMNGEQRQVVQERKNKSDVTSPMIRKIGYVFTARQRALMAGQPVPLMRARLTKEQKKALELENAKRLLSEAEQGA
jgi:hypothetical protein